MIHLGRTLIMALVMSLVACTQTIIQEDIEAPTNPTNVVVSEPLDILSSHAPLWRVGDTWHYSDGYGLKVSTVLGNDTTFQRLDSRDDWVVRRGLFKVRSKQGNIQREVVYRTNDPEDLFPLSKGKQVVFLEEYLRADELIRRNTSWTVEGQETIQVPAGTFNCWVLVMRTRSLQSNWLGSERWWYSPDIKHYVRLEYRYGTEPPGARVLTSYSLVK